MKRILRARFGLLLMLVGGACQPADEELPVTEARGANTKIRVWCADGP